MRYRLRNIVKFFGYALALVGASFGGFPPPRRFVPQELPEEVMERVVDDTELEDIGGQETHRARRIDRDVPRVPTPENH